jgi:ABC-2 type transport system permease protein
MLKLLTVELYKILTKPRSYIGFIAIASIVIIIQIAFFIDGQQYLDFVFQSFNSSFDINGKVLNGSLMTFIILQMLIVQLPLLVALVTGDLISGEASAGTIRFLLTKPFSRSQILFAKLIAGLVYTFLLILLLGVLSLGLGYFLFGFGDLVVLKSEELVILQSSDLSWRFMAAFLVAFISLSLVSCFSLMLSCFTDNSITPIVASMSVIIIFTIIGTLELPVLDNAKPFLFTTHMIIWRNLFDNPIDMNQLLFSISILSLHIFLFTGISFYHFNKKDILN